MRTEEIKETKVIGTKYIADDGNVFYSQEECIKYEQSALFVAKSKLKVIANTNEEEMTGSGCYDYDVNVFDIQTQEDLDNLKAYLHLVLSTNKVGDIESVFNDSKYGFVNVTYGHEVIVWWSYEQDNFWIYGDGSIDAYVDYVRQLAINTIEKHKKAKEEEIKEV